MEIIAFTRPLVLATASEARRALVKATGIPHTTQIVTIEETPLFGETVASYVERLAQAKAKEAKSSASNTVIVAVDTAIGFNNTIIGKPRDEGHACEILTSLSGKTHEVVSAIAVRDLLTAKCQAEITRTEVDFAPLSVSMIDWYLESGEWQNRAGAYAIQGKGAALISSVRGCYTNVIGISIPVFLKMLAAINARAS